MDKILLSLLNFFIFQLRVGQIVKVRGGHNFPADLVILSSSETMGMGML
jgi:magnesium-transporting ATPase (P-type)